MNSNSIIPPRNAQSVTILDDDDQVILSIAVDGSVTVSENFRASEAAEQFLSALTTIVSERDRLRRVVYAVATAWTNPGPVPAYHRKQQIKLINNWPVLVWAVQRAVSEKE